MRVITGTAKGRRLETLEGADVRPTTDMVKEAVFSVLQFNLPGRCFLDLFAGSGQMGIEALSRGAREAYFIDGGKRPIDVIKKNIEATKFQDKAKVINTEAASFLMRTNESFDIAFLDPPYGTGVLQETLPLVAAKMNKGGIIVCESPQNEELPAKIDNFILDRNYRYGKIKISTYCHEEVTEE
ncbi:MAG TPA: 16S rRNA (guanine(966)-N(2))-methyltransferase RsmD [Clostridiales bacterium]|nr:16S rRNA (guanine(966)-N(2))-methyltransferase RsmD [Clostridiales bacterium]